MNYTQQSIEQHRCALKEDGRVSAYRKSIKTDPKTLFVTKLMRIYL